MKKPKYPKLNKFDRQENTFSSTFLSLYTFNIFFLFFVSKISGWQYLLKVDRLQNAGIKMQTSWDALLLYYRQIHVIETPK